MRVQFFVGPLPVVAVPNSAARANLGRREWTM